MLLPSILLDGCSELRPVQIIHDGARRRHREFVLHVDQLTSDVEGDIRHPLHGLNNIPDWWNLARTANVLHQKRRLAGRHAARAVLPNALIGVLPQNGAKLGRVQLVYHGRSGGQAEVVLDVHELVGYVDVYASNADKRLQNLFNRRYLARAANVLDENRRLAGRHFGGGGGIPLVATLTLEGLCRSTVSCAERSEAHI